MGVNPTARAGLFVALSASLLFALAACGGGSKPATDTPAASPSAVIRTPAAQSTASAGETPTIAASTSPVPDPIAQPVTRGDFRLTMNGVTDPYVPTDDAFTATDGDHWVLIDVTLTNVTQGELDYGADYFEVFDADDLDYGASSASQPQEFDVGTLAAGETVRGQLAFEVPDEVQLTRLVFDPDFDPATEIDISLP